MASPSPFDYPPPETAPTPSRFESLLEELLAEHKRENEELREQISMLEAQALVENDGANGPVTKEENEEKVASYFAAASKSRSSITRTATNLSTATERSSVARFSIGNMVKQESTVTFPMRNEWNRMVTPAHEGDQIHLPREESKVKRPVSTRLQTPFGDNYAKPPSKWSIHPNSNPKFVWDMIGLSLITYDFITIPMQVFPLRPSATTEVMAFITTFFWAVDMIMSCFSAYYHGGVLYADNRSMLFRYLKSWFIIDAVVVVPDVMITLLDLVVGSGNTQFSKFARILRATRAVRVLRLLRLGKVRKMIGKLYDTLDNEYAFICMSMFELVGYVVMLNHLLACLWYGVGRLGQMRGEVNWLECAGYTPVDGQGLDWKYSTSLHWSLTQLTPAAMDVSATNTIERIFSVIVLLFGLAVFSSVNGSVTASVTAIRNLNAGQSNDLWMLRRFMRQKNISPDLSFRLQKFLEHQSRDREKEVPESRLTILKSVSIQLREELAYELHSQRVDQHPLFEYFQQELKTTLFEICNQGLTTSNYAEKDCVFRVNDEAHVMFFVKRGMFSYEVNGAFLSPDLAPRNWISEAALWTNWRNAGDLEALEPSEMLALAPQHMATIMAKHPRTWDLTRSYARMYLNLLTVKAATGSLTDKVNPSDIPDHFPGVTIRSLDPRWQESRAARVSEISSAIADGTFGSEENGNGMPSSPSRPSTQSVSPRDPRPSQLGRSSEFSSLNPLPQQGPNGEESRVNVDDQPVEPVEPVGRPHGRVQGVTVPSAGQSPAVKADRDLPSAGQSPAVKADCALPSAGQSPAVKADRGSGRSTRNAPRTVCADGMTYLARGCAQTE